MHTTHVTVMHFITHAPPSYTAHAHALVRSYVKVERHPQLVGVIYFDLEIEIQNILHHWKEELKI